MTEAEAIAITHCATRIGMALTGLTAEVSVEDIAAVRRLSLGQLETAAEIVEAYNLAPAPAPRVIHVVCEARLLVHVKTYADAAQV